MSAERTEIKMSYSSPPWRDWIPGVLSREQLRILCKKKYIIDSDEEPDFSSIDLSIGDECYVMRKGSVKPSLSHRYEHLLRNGDIAEKLSALRDGRFNLDAKKTYVFCVQEQLCTRLAKSGLFGQATAKSSIGRLDVLARLVVDGMDCYEHFDSNVENFSGKMFVEVTPMTFDIALKQGTKLSQLRLFKGQPEHCEIRGKELYESILFYDDSQETPQGMLSVDLAPHPMDSGKSVSVFRSTVKKTSSSRSRINVWDKQKASPSDYWKAETWDKDRRLRITKGSFYIMRSQERIAVPEGVAVYCRASDETIGEMRIHYAGFVHPCFGKYREDDKQGSPLIFEVRGHDIDVNLNHGEKMARLAFYRMSQDVEVLRPEKKKLQKDPYMNQELALSKYFGKWSA